MEYTNPDIKFMKIFGFSVEYNWRDKDNGRTTMENPPFFPIIFVNAKKNVWRIKSGWQTANLIDGRFTNHFKCDNLTEVVAFCGL